MGLPCSDAAIAFSKNGNFGIDQLLDHIERRLVATRKLRAPSILDADVVRPPSNSSDLGVSWWKCVSRNRLAILEAIAPHGRS